MYFHYFIIISPWKRGGGLHLNKFESPSSRNTLCQVWLKLAIKLWRGRFLNFINVFSLFNYNLPLERTWPFIWTNFKPLYPMMLCAIFYLNWPSGSWEEDVNVKSIQTDGQTDEERQVIRKAHSSFQLRWAKKAKGNFLNESLPHPLPCYRFAECIKPLSQMLHLVHYWALGL